MSDLSDRMRGVDDVPFQQDWDAVRTRVSSGQVRSTGSRRPSPKPTRRAGVVAVALVASIASLAFLLISFNGPAPSSVGTTHTPNPSTPVIDGWYVSMSYGPTSVGPLAVSFGPIRQAPGKAWVTHGYTITNQSDETVQLEDSRTSTFLGPHKNILAESGCGYWANGPNKPVHANACETVMVPRTLKPGHSFTTSITLLTGLPGMGPLTSGTYVFNQPIAYTIPSKKMVAPSRAHVHVTYQVADAYGITGGASLSGTYTDPMGIPITFTYPSTWFARSVSASADGLSEGAAISNAEEAVPPTDPGVMPNASPPLDYVRVTIFTANGRLGLLPDSVLPLSMDNAKVSPGSENVKVLDATVGGTPLVIEVSAGPNASQADIDSADAIVASIKPSDPVMPSPVNGIQPNLPPASSLDTCAGLPVTIVASEGEKVEGTSGNDVVAMDPTATYSPNGGIDIICDASGTVQSISYPDGASVPGTPDQVARAIAKLGGTGVIAGTLVMVGGPTDARFPVPGEVSVMNIDQSGPIVFNVEVQPDGSFSTVVDPGTYQVLGISPKYSGGTEYCVPTSLNGTVSVQAGEHVSVDVECQMR